MGSDLSKKNLLGRVERDAWKAVTGTRTESYQFDDVGVTLMHSVDRALFERKNRDALRTGFILEKWGEHNIHFSAQAPAVMSSVYSVCRLFNDAEYSIVLARKRVNPDCDDCQAQYLKRLGTFHFHQQTHRQAIKAYSQSAELFIAIGKSEEAAMSLLNRGASKYYLRQYEGALADEEHALELLGDECTIYTIMCSINIVGILLGLKKLDEALERIKSIQDGLVGENDIERPKLILRWVRALLLEAEEKLKDAGEMMDRIEPRMRRYDMKPELKVLLADRARVARQTDMIQEIARKALEMEEIPRIQRIIEKVITEPTREHIISWRNALDSYVPAFPTTI